MFNVQMFICLYFNFTCKDCESFKRLMAVNQSPSPHRVFEADGTTIMIDYAQVFMQKMTSE